MGMSRMYLSQHGCGQRLHCLRYLLPWQAQFKAVVRRPFALRKGSDSFGSDGHGVRCWLACPKYIEILDRTFLSTLKSPALVFRVRAKEMEYSTLWLPNVSLLMPSASVEYGEGLVL